MYTSKLRSIFAYLIFNFIGDLENINQLIKNKIIFMKHTYCKQLEILSAIIKWLFIYLLIKPMVK